MTLQVPYSDFSAAAKRFEVREAYICAKRGATEVSAVMKETGRILFARTDMAVEEVRKDLTAKNLHVFDGAWSIDPPEADATQAAEVFVTAVAYTSAEAMPGIWIDAFPWQPTQVQVLRALYDEFRATGEVAEIPFEEFMRAASPNVAIVSPLEIAGFIESKAEC